MNLGTMRLRDDLPLQMDDYASGIRTGFLSLFGNRNVELCVLRGIMRFYFHGQFSRPQIQTAKTKKIEHQSIFKTNSARNQEPTSTDKDMKQLCSLRRIPVAPPQNNKDARLTYNGQITIILRKNDFLAFL